MDAALCIKLGPGRYAWGACRGGGDRQARGIGQIVLAKVDHDAGGFYLLLHQILLERRSRGVLRYYYECPRTRSAFQG